MSMAWPVIVRWLVGKLSSESSAEDVRLACWAAAHLPAEDRREAIIDIAQRVDWLDRWTIRREVKRQLDRLSYSSYESWPGPSLKVLFPEIPISNGDKLKIPPGYRIKDGSIFTEEVDSLRLVAADMLFVCEDLIEENTGMYFSRIVFLNREWGEWRTAIVSKLILASSYHLFYLVRWGVLIQEYKARELVKFFDIFHHFNRRFIPTSRFNVVKDEGPFIMDKDTSSKIRKVLTGRSRRRAR